MTWLRRSRDPKQTRTTVTQDARFSLPFILPGNVHITIEADTCQQALLVIRRDYGVKAAKEAFLAE